MDRFFVDIPSLDLNEITLPPEESKHIAKVLRKKVGDVLEVVNGKGEVFVGEISVNDSKNVIVKRLSFVQNMPEDYYIHIAIAPTKNNDRLEWFIEKATELGIHEISPILCDNSERKVIKLERFERILVAAMKQSKRVFKPKLNELISFRDFVSKYPNGLIAHCYEEENRNTTIKKEIHENKLRWKTENSPILIGPEGDFSLKEVQLAIDKGYKAITLGKTRLRTETAGVYACTILKLFFEEE